MTPRTHRRLLAAIAMSAIEARRDLAHAPDTAQTRANLLALLTVEDDAAAALAWDLPHARDWLRYLT